MRNFFLKLLFNQIETLNSVTLIAKISPVNNHFLKLKTKTRPILVQNFELKNFICEKTLFEICEQPMKSAKNFFCLLLRLQTLFCGQRNVLRIFFGFFLYL